MIRMVLVEWTTIEEDTPERTVAQHMAICLHQIADAIARGEPEGQLPLAEDIVQWTMQEDVSLLDFFQRRS